MIFMAVATRNEEHKKRPEKAYFTAILIIKIITTATLWFDRAHTCEKGRTSCNTMSRTVCDSVSINKTFVELLQIQTRHRHSAIRSTCSPYPGFEVNLVCFPSRTLSAAQKNQRHPCSSLRSYPARRQTEGQTHKPTRSHYILPCVR